MALSPTAPVEDAPEDLLTHVRALAAASGPLDDVTAVAVRRSVAP